MTDQDKILEAAIFKIERSQKLNKVQKKWAHQYACYRMGKSPEPPASIRELNGKTTDVPFLVELSRSVDELLGLEPQAP